MVYGAMTSLYKNFTTNKKDCRTLNQWSGSLFMHCSIFELAVIQHIIRINYTSRLPCRRLLFVCLTGKFYTIHH